MRILVSLSREVQLPKNLLAGYRTQFGELRLEAANLLSTINKRLGLWHTHRKRLHQISDLLHRIETASYQVFKKGGDGAAEFRTFYTTVLHFNSKLKEFMDRFAKADIKKLDEYQLYDPDLGKSVDKPDYMPAWMMKYINTKQASGQFSHDNAKYVWTLVDKSRGVVEVVKKIAANTFYYSAPV